MNTCIMFIMYSRTNKVCNKETNEQMQNRNTRSGQGVNLELQDEKPIP